MKKHFFLFAFALIMFSCSASTSPAQNITTDWDEYYLKGQVKRLIIRTFKAHEESDELVKDELWSTTIVDFSSDGKIQQEERINESKETYVYLDKRTIINYYDANGLLKCKKITSYTDWGGINDILSITADGVEFGRTNYVYNKERRLLERIHQDMGSPYIREANILFDSIGHEIRCERYNKENLLEEIISNTYDVNGKKILRSVKRYEDGVYAYGGRIRFTYNAEGFVCLVESCDDTDIYRVTNKFSYSYDKYGNFTVENNFNDFFPLIKERTIIYY